MGCHRCLSKTLQLAWTCISHAWQQGAAPAGDDQLGPLLLAAAEAKQVIEGVNLVCCIVKVFAAKHEDFATSLQHQQTLL